MADIFKQQEHSLSSTRHTEIVTEPLIFVKKDSFTVEIEQQLPVDNLLSIDVITASNNLQPTTTTSQEGILLVWGCGEFGQHGHGHQNDISLTNGVNHPLLIGQGGLVSMVACGSSHTICITDDDRIYSWGNGNSGQLGIGKTTTVFQPNLVQLGVSLGTRLKGVACGTRHTYIWTEEGDCYSFGNNFSAQLGYDFRKPDFKENQPSPTYLEHLFNQKILQVACGSRHSIFLFSSGLVASVGSNDRGQLGLDSKTSSVCIQTVPDIHDISVIGCGNCHCLAADGSGNVYAWGYGKACGSKNDILSPKHLCKYEEKKIKILDGGDSHSMLLLDDGSLFSWGVNFEGQLGLGDCIKFQTFPTEIRGEELQGNVTSISLGENTSAAVTGDGLLFMWGRNVSQVIRHDEGPRYCQFVPVIVSLSNWKANKVSCGSWHVACIVNSHGNTSKDHLSDKQCKKNESKMGKEASTPTDEIVTTTYQEEYDTEDLANVNDNKTVLQNQKELKKDQCVYSDKELESMPKQEHIQNSSVLSETKHKVQMNNEVQKSSNKIINSTHAYNEIPVEIVNSAKRNSKLRRTQSEDLSMSKMNNISIQDPLPQKQENLGHYSKFFSDFATERDNVEVHVQRSNTDGVTRDSIHSSEYKTNPANIKYDIHKASKPKDNEVNPVVDTGLCSTDTTPVIDSSLSASLLNTDTKSCDSSHLNSAILSSIDSTLFDSNHSANLSSTDTTLIDDSSLTASLSSADTTPFDSSHQNSSSLSSTEITPVDSSNVASLSSTDKIPFDSNPSTNLVTQLSSANTTPLASSHSLILSSANTKSKVSGHAVGHLHREKKPPRHLRQVPKSMEYNNDLPSRSAGHKKDSRYHYSDQLQRTQSSPTLNISSFKLEVFTSSKSTPSTPPLLTHVPHPPSKSNKGLPPKHPGPKRAQSQKIVYSSGSSWRKRDPKF